nr:uncharacterized protein LOC125181337 [Anser cygnoides]
MAPLRRLCLCLPALLLLLLLPAPPVAAAPAPVPVPVPVPGTDWAACKNLSRELSRLLGTLKEPHSELVSGGAPPGWGDRRNRGGEGMCLAGGVSGLLGVLRVPRRCGGRSQGAQGCPGWSPGVPDLWPHPQLLLPQRCLRRILQGLQHYRDLLGSEIFSAHRLPQLEATLDRLLGVVQQAPGRPCQAPLGPTTPTWAESLLPQLRHQALEQLQSFTAVMRRVFTYSARPH